MQNYLSSNPWPTHFDVHIVLRSLKIVFLESSCVILCRTFYVNFLCQIVFLWSVKDSLSCSPCLWSVKNTVVNTNRQQSTKILFLKLMRIFGLFLSYKQFSKLSDITGHPVSKRKLLVYLFVLRFSFTKLLGQFTCGFLQNKCHKKSSRFQQGVLLSPDPQTMCFTKF